MQVKHPWLLLVSCLAAATALAACGDATPAPVHQGSGGTGGTGAGGSSSHAGTGNTAGSLGTGGTSTGVGGSSGGASGGGGTSSVAGTSSGGAAGTGISGGDSGGTGGSATGGGGTGGGAAACPSPAASHSTTTCTRACWKTSASDCANYVDWAILNPPVNAVDGDPVSRFSTGVPQVTPATFQIDMGSAVTVDGIKLDSATDATDFAQFYQIDVSTDGTAWTPVACGPGATVTDIAFTPSVARYVRVTQVAVNSGSWWSVHEINVYCPATDTCGPATGGEGGEGGGGPGAGGDGPISEAGAGGASADVSTAPTGSLDACTTVHHH